MKNSEIKYNLSRDYTRLKNLLTDGVHVIGFIAVSVDGRPNAEYSKVIEMKYFKKYKEYSIGFTIWEDQLEAHTHSFSSICEKYNIQYFDPFEESVKAVKVIDILNLRKTLYALPNNIDGDHNRGYVRAINDAISEIEQIFQ